MLYFVNLILSFGLRILGLARLSLVRLFFGFIRVYHTRNYFSAERKLDCNLEQVSVNAYSENSALKLCKALRYGESETGALNLTVSGLITADKSVTKAVDIKVHLIL